MKTAILDANTLYPAPLRDYLLHLAALGLFKPRWTATIQQEWIRNLLLNRPDLNKRDLEKTRNAMDAAFPGADVEGYETLINTTVLPDPDDRHVLAAAIAANADAIVTNNLKDFPPEALAPYFVTAVSPDDFVLQLIATETETTLLALQNQVKLLRNPPLPIATVLTYMENCGLVKSVGMLKSNMAMM